jgi:hypothetical protein
MAQPERHSDDCSRGMLTLPTIAGNRKKRPNRAANFIAHRNRDPAGAKKGTQLEWGYSYAALHRTKIRARPTEHRLYSGMMVRRFGRSALPPARRRPA